MYYYISFYYTLRLSDIGPRFVAILLHFVLDHLLIPSFSSFYYASIAVFLHHVEEHLIPSSTIFLSVCGTQAEGLPPPRHCGRGSV